ncbi:hypothetical protein AAFF_G00006120 [Aldrovandia affinis]|uniref:Uncharacterized protein n=1 Tax=Aldrovandia affinis TaxID=143900 RepID=A0AAD7X452_9TELE|nr:hypothetical protein AAFF_G00006120 [Aldrovandia affinis]
MHLSRFSIGKVSRKLPSALMRSVLMTSPQLKALQSALPDISHPLEGEQWEGARPGGRHVTLLFARLACPDAHVCASTPSASRGHWGNTGCPPTQPAPSWQGPPPRLIERRPRQQLAPAAKAKGGARFACCQVFNFGDLFHIGESWQRPAGTWPPIRGFRDTGRRAREEPCR